MELLKRRGRRPSTFVGLASMRARVAGEVQLRQALLAEAQGLLDDCDRTILRLYPNGAPQRIPSVRAWKYFSGRRGTLRTTLLTILRGSSPDSRCAGEVLRLEVLLLRITADLEKTKGDLASLDRVIRLADKRIDPTSARAVRPQRVPNKDGGKKRSLEEATVQIRRASKRRSELNGTS